MVRKVSRRDFAKYISHSAIGAAFAQKLSSLKELWGQCQVKT